MSPLAVVLQITNQARNVLALASEEARRYNHNGVGTEHVLLALLSEDEGIAVKALAQLQVQENDIRKRIETLHPEEHDHQFVEGLIGTLHCLAEQPIPWIGFLSGILQRIRPSNK